MKLEDAIITLDELIPEPEVACEGESKQIAEAWAVIREVILTNNGKWRKVSEELPEVSEEKWKAYIVRMKEGKICTLYYYAECDIWMDEEMIICDGVTHWQELPATPMES